MCSIDLEPCEVWNESIQRAKKEHTCACCGRIVKSGHRYAKVFMVFEGQATTERSCLPCWRAGGVFADAHDGMRCTPGSLEDMIVECIDEGDEGVGQWKRMLTRIRARYPKPAPPAHDGAKHGQK